MKRTLRARVLCLMAMVALALPLAIAGPTGAAHAAIPSGFQIVNYPTGHAPGMGTALTDFAFTPDNKGYYSLGKGGSVRWSSLDGRINREIARLSVTTQQDLGAVSIDLGHNYGLPGGSNSLWIVRIRPDGRPGRCPEDNACGENVLSEFNVNFDAAGNPVSLGAERRVLWFPNRDITHGMDSVVVDKDGSLWVSIGDGASFREMDPDAFDAQRRDSPYGRIMHIDREGAGMPTNPEFDPRNSHAWYSKTYARGFRNPFRLRLHPTLGLPMVGDVGWNTTEEHNIVRRGGNYGWPCWEGTARTPEYSTRLAGCATVTSATPIFQYSRDRGMGSSAMGGIIYTGTPDGSPGYPSSYVGTYFFADYTAGRIYTMRFNDTATALVTPPNPAGWATNVAPNAVGIPVSLKHAANGDVAYSDFASGNIRRLSYISSNRSPVANASYRTTSNANEVAFTLDASDPDNDPLSYRWTFGDGTTSTDPNPVKRYGSAGTYDVRVVVTDGRGGSTTVDLRVNTADGTPTLTLTTPPATRTYAVGDAINLTATATDDEDGALTADVQWSTQLETCKGDVCETTTGPSATGGTYNATYTVGAGDFTNWHITARVTDSSGATQTQTYVARPTLRSLTVTNNAGAPISINGALGGTRQIAVGSSVGLVAPRSADGTTFMRWSDGSDLSSRTITMPNSDLALEAVYSTRISQRYDSDAAARATLGAPVGPEVSIPGVGRQQVYERGHMYYSESAGVRMVYGAILATYISQGGAARLGVPTTDEIATPDGGGRMNNFAGTAANPSPVIYWKPATGAHLVMGSIKAQHDTMGATRGVHGYPRNSESTTPNGRAQYNDFENGGIYWSGTTGARSVYGAIYGTWSRFGWEAGHLGLPTTSELATPNGRGRYNHFEGGSIYWSPATGANEIRGSIRAKWAGLGWETSLLRFPTTNELPTPDRVGRFNHFEGGSIYWSPRTGAWEVHGLIREEWARRGWERSSLGYPTSDEFAVPGGRRSNFERGYIEWVNGRINVVVR
ncbi:PKD domain-containing protein [Granulicoccus sp. GXG6511]|uniref:PKD domain-containing protein n=1 Tax=Granulicoccus sp. GXG6511 TaxID=3381351 RepID=UPI003D7CBCB9